MNAQNNIALLRLLELTRNPYEISEELGIKVSDVRRVMPQLDLSDLPGWGRVKLQPHIVSRRRVSALSWPSEHLGRLIECRRQHDQGRVNMCQGRDGEWIIQYAIPNQRPIRRLPYFFGGGC